MKKLSFLAILSLLVACDDGDFSVPSFSFEGLTINNCGNIVLDKITTSGTETLIIQLSVDNTEDKFFKTPLDSLYVRIDPNIENKMYYKIFNGSITPSFFCQEIPPSTPTITEEWFGEGDLYITNTITLDDSDGVPAEKEDVNGNGDLTDDDTDGDGYPNYIDIDDDGDGKLTKNEKYNIVDGVMVATEDIYLVDTDGDGTPNYLDTDDDNDGILSINESQTEDIDNDLIVDYLDDDHPENAIDPAEPITNNYLYKYVMRLEFSTLTLSNQNSTINYQDGYNYGTTSGEFSENKLPPSEEEEPGQ